MMWCVFGNSSRYARFFVRTAHATSFCDILLGEVGGISAAAIAAGMTLPQNIITLLFYAYKLGAFVFSTLKNINRTWCGDYFEIMCDSSVFSTYD